MKKRIVSVCLTLMLVTVMAAGCGAQKSNEDSKVIYNWKGAYVLSENNPGSDGLKEFARLLEEKSDGRIKAECYFGGQLGSEKETIEAIQMGSLDFMIASTASLSSFTDSQLLWDLPYLFESREAARGVLDSDLGKECLDAMKDVKIKGLTYFENGMYAMCAKEPIESLDDLKGKKIRSHESKVQADTYIALGGTSVVIPWNDCYTALQNGTCDALSSTTVPNMYTAKFHEVAPYITMTEHVYSPVPLMMSKNVWDSLPEDIQDIVMESAEEAKQVERDAVIESEENCKKEMEKEGAQFIEIDKKTWIEKAQKVYDQYVGKGGIDADLVNRIKEEAKKY